jgi:hypothetical protein
MVAGILNNTKLLNINHQKMKSYGKELTFVTSDSVIFTLHESFRCLTLTKNLKPECLGMIFASKFRVEVFMI